MDLNQLKSFVAVAHQGNLTQAAETLHLSQPAVSAQIKAIERKLNITLFERNAQGMALTRTGAALLPQAEALLQHMHRLDQYAASLAQDHQGQIELGLTRPLPSARVAQLAACLRRQPAAPHLRCHWGFNGDIINAVRKKELHAGFFLGHNPYRNVQSLWLEDSAHVLVAPTAWQADIESGRSLGDFDWLDCSPLSGSHQPLRQLWRSLRISPAQHVLCDPPDTLAAMSAAGLGLALLPLADAEQAQAQGLPLFILPQHHQVLPLHFVYANEFEHDPMVAALKTALATVWPQAHPV